MGRFDDGATWERVKVEALTQNERRLIMEGDLGYCENHQVLYRKACLDRCLIYSLACKCDDPSHSMKLAEVGECKEWGDVVVEGKESSPPAVTRSLAGASPVDHPKIFEEEMNKLTKSDYIPIALLILGGLWFLQQGPMAIGWFLAGLLIGFVVGVVKGKRILTNILSKSKDDEA